MPLRLFIIVSYPCEVSNKISILVNPVALSDQDEQIVLWLIQSVSRPVIGQTLQFLFSNCLKLTIKVHNFYNIFDDCISTTNLTNAFIVAKDNVQTETSGEDTDAVHR